MFRASNELNHDLFQATRKWIIRSEASDDPKNLQLAASANRNLQSLGFTLSQEALYRLASLDKDTLVEVYKDLYNSCEDVIGVKELKDAIVFYPNFPEQVMEMDELDHYINQMVHYLGSYVFDETILPDTENAERVELLEGFERKPKVIELGTDQDIINLMHNYMFANNTLPHHKHEMLSRFMNESKIWVSWIAANKIPNKENRIMIADIIMKDDSIPVNVKREHLSDILTDSVDVLRFAAHLSNGKTHTQKVKYKALVWDKNKPRHYEWRTKREKTTIQNDDIVNKVFFKLNRTEEKLVKTLLSTRKDLFTAIWLRPDLFKSLANNISVNDVKHPRLTKAFDNLFHDIHETELGSPVKSPYAIINGAIESVKKNETNAFGDLEHAAGMFPGIFSRNLFHAIDVCHNNTEIQKVCDIYASHGKNVPVRELLKLYNLVEMQSSERVIYMAKQNKYISKPLSESREFSYETKIKIKEAIMLAIKEHFKDCLAINIYIDNTASNLLLPENGERNASKGSALTTGSSYNGRSECNIVRQFIWWTNEEKSRVDIDTAVSFYDADMKPVATCSYYNNKAYIDELNEDNIIAVHSGDIVDGGPTDGPGAAEYIDIDKKIARDAGIKYAILSVSAYSGQPYCNLPNVKFGMMEREGNLDMHIADDPFVFNGRIYEPSTVDMYIDLNSNSKQTIPVIYDIEADKYIWIDKSITGVYGIINPENEKTIETLDLMIKRYAPASNPTPSVSDLFMAYAMATNSNLVSNISEADIVVSMNKDSIDTSLLKENAVVYSAFEMDEISARFMASDVNLLRSEVITTEDIELDSIDELEL